MSALAFKLIYTSDGFKVEADTALAVVRTEWLQPLTDNQFKSEAMQAYDIIIDLQASRVLVNAQEVSILGSDTKDWLSNTYYGLFSGTCVQKMARVMPDNIFKKIALNSVLARANATTEISYIIRDFTSEGEAIRWLLED